MNSVKAKLLLVDDDPDLLRLLSIRLQGAGYAVSAVESAEAALSQVSVSCPDVVITDLRMGGMDGMALFESLQKKHPALPVIILTAHGTIPDAVAATQRGVFGYLTKPFEGKALIDQVEKALQFGGTPIANGVTDTSWRADIITRSPEMLKLCRTVERVATTNATVLLLGESGTGKELLARALHDLSGRRAQKFVAINCAAIPENLLESELFGYEKGAFTGAVKQTPGKLELANKGTLFLDEIGDLPTSLQAKLLRFLQERVVERVGGRAEISVDVRIVCATHQDLKELISAGKFREDLYYRLAEIVLPIPPLRSRPGDASLLAHAFVRRFATEQHRGTMTLLPAAIDAIEAHGWPGNVRELENCTKRAVIMAEASTLRAEDFGLEISSADPEMFNLRRVRDNAEREAVVRVLGRVNGNISRAAEVLGVSRPTLYDLMERFGLRPQ